MVLLILAETIPYSPRDLLLEPVGRPVRQRLPADPVVLMAFGRGEMWGQGLGNSVQKLEYLPEAHTDFIFAIIGEELGYIGVVSLALLMVFFVAFPRHVDWP